MSQDKLKHYAHAMTIDRDTGKPMPKTALTGNKVAEQKTEVDAVGGALTFADDIDTIGIFNTDTTNKGIFNVNGIDIHVPPSTPVEYGIAGTPSNIVTVTGATTYIVTRLV